MGCFFIVALGFASRTTLWWFRLWFRCWTCRGNYWARRLGLRHWLQDFLDASWGTCNSSS